MTEIELLGYMAVPRFSINEQGDLLSENSQATYPHEEIFEVDVPF